MRGAPFVLLSLGLLALPVGLADHGIDENGRPCATSANAVAIGPLYVVGTPVPWIYLESNSMSGLQRGSEAATSSGLIFGPDDVTCSHPDTVLF